jgi:DNA-directed RNA polymerase subunit RPC12/RpoP
MAVRWGCPECGAETVEDDPFSLDQLRCARCGSESARREVLCIVCDAPDALHRRDTVHVECPRCGERQMIFAPILAHA